MASHWWTPVSRAASHWWASRLMRLGLLPPANWRPVCVASLGRTQPLITGHIFNPMKKAWRDAPSLNVRRRTPCGPHLAAWEEHAWPAANLTPAVFSAQVKRPRPFPGGPAVVVASGRIWAVATGMDAHGRETVESIGPGEGSWRLEGSLPPPVLLAVGETVILLTLPFHPD